MRAARFAILLALLVACATAQDKSRVYFIQRTVSGTLNRITIAQPSTGIRPLEVKGIFFSCSVACSPLITSGGTVSSGSAGTILKYDKRAPAATAVATLDGTIGGSPETVFSRDIATANGERAHEGGLFLPAVAGSPTQFTVEITAVGSGSLYIFLVYGEP